MIPMLAIAVPPQFTNFCQIMLEFATLSILPDSLSLDSLTSSIPDPISDNSTLRKLTSSSSNSSDMLLNFQLMDIF